MAQEFWAVAYVGTAIINLSHKSLMFLFPIGKFPFHEILRNHFLALFLNSCHPLDGLAKQKQ